MLNLIARISLNGILLAVVLPRLFGDISFHGGLWPEGILAGLIFAIVAWVVDFLLAIVGVLTLGIGMVLRWFFWFLIPALQIWAMSAWFPQYLTVSSIQSAVLAGFVLMLVNAMTGRKLTGEAKKKKKNKRDD